MDFPDLAQLPPWAAVLFVVSLAVVFVGIRTGWLSGVMKSGPSSAQAEVAAVIVDPKALNDAAAAADRLAGAHDRLTAQVDKLCDLMAQIIADTREERDAEEREALYRKGFEDAQAARRPVRRSRSAKSG